MKRRGYVAGSDKEYEAAGGDDMTREQAVRHFHNREVRLKANIRSLPVAEKLRLAADFIDAGAHMARIAFNIAKLAVAECGCLAAMGGTIDSVGVVASLAGADPLTAADAGLSTIPTEADVTAARRSSGRAEGARGRGASAAPGWGEVQS